MYYTCIGSVYTLKPDLKLMKSAQAALDRQLKMTAVDRAIAIQTLASDLNKFKD